MSQRRLLAGMGGNESIEFGLGQIPWIDVLARRRGLDRQERLAAIVERGRDRTLEQAVERGEIARMRVAGLIKARLGGKRLPVALALVNALEDVAYLDQLRHRLALARREMGNVGREPGGLGAG